jgi:hypothetical protein
LEPGQDKAAKNKREVTERQADRPQGLFVVTLREREGRSKAHALAACLAGRVGLFGNCRVSSEAAMVATHRSSSAQTNKGRMAPKSHSAGGERVVSSRLGLLERQRGVQILHSCKPEAQDNGGADENDPFLKGFLTGVSQRNPLSWVASGLKGETMIEDSRSGQPCSFFLFSSSREPRGRLCLQTQSALT